MKSSLVILGDPGAVSRDDRMFVVKLSLGTGHYLSRGGGGGGSGKSCLRRRVGQQKSSKP